MPEYLAASLLCSINLIFVIVAVLLLSLQMSDIVAFLCVLGVGIVGFVADGIAAASHSQIAQSIVQQSAASPPVKMLSKKCIHQAAGIILQVFFSQLPLGDVDQGKSALLPRNVCHGFELYEERTIFLARERDFASCFVTV